MSLLPGRRYLSNWELAEEQKKFLQKIHDEKTAQGLRQLTPYMYETLEQKLQREELAKTAFNDAQLKFNSGTRKWQLRDARATAN